MRLIKSKIIKFWQGKVSYPNFKKIPFGWKKNCMFAAK